MAAHHHVLVLLCEGEGEGEGREGEREGGGRRGRDGGGKRRRGRGAREVVVCEDTVHITALIITYLSLSHLIHTHSVPRELN